MHSFEPVLQAKLYESRHTQSMQCEYFSANQRAERQSTQCLLANQRAEMEVVMSECQKEAPAVRRWNLWASCPGDSLSQ